MSAVLLVPLAIMLGGAFLYALASNAKLAEMGRILFFVGAFWLVAIYARSELRLP